MGASTRAARRHPDRHAGNGQVAVAWCTGGLVVSRFVDSVCGLLLADRAGAGRIASTTSLLSGPRIAEARNQIVRSFLHKSDAEWLLMLDDDMVFDADLLELLIAEADPVERPVMGGLCFAGDLGSAIRPTLYRFTDPSGSMETIYDYPRDAVVKVDATGAACLLLHRSILNRMGNHFATLADGITPNPYPWFAEGLSNRDGSPYGEDIAFFLRLQRVQGTLHVHTGVRLGHVKTRVLDEATFDLTREHS